MERDTLWQSVLGELEGNLSRANFRMWFKDTFIAEDTGDTIVIGVPNNFYLSWIRDKFHKNIAETLRRLRPTLRDISYKVATPTPAAPTEPATLELHQETVKAPTFSDFSELPTSNTPSAPTRTAPQYDEPVIIDGPTLRQPSNPNQFSPSSFQPTITEFDQTSLTPPGHTPLDPGRTFDTFIVGNSNRLAHAVSLAAAAEPGTKYNPLFLYGAAGMGKTHLAQAIGNEIKKKTPGVKITYVSCETFVNEFIDSLRKKNTEAFKKRFRHSDVLLIDDVQFLSGKESTQEEFFHTFNALHQAKKQIVLTADQEPRNIPAMEDRLTSRFAWGMVADIQPPDFETRIAILRAKCIERHYQVDNESLQTLAQLIQSSIRELEGGLQQLITRAEIEGRPITPEFVTEIFSGIAGTNRSRGLNARRIIEIVSEFFEIKPDEITGSRRYKELVYPRQLVMYLIRHELSFSYPKIGKELGGKDHTTVMHGVEKIEKEIARNANIQYDLAKLKERLYQGIER